MLDGAVVHIALVNFLRTKNMKLFSEVFGKNWLVVSTHLKNMLVKLDHFPRDRGEHKKYLKPPLKKTMKTMELPVATHSEMSSKRKIPQIRKGPKYFKLNDVNKRSLYTNILIAVSSKALHFKNISMVLYWTLLSFKSCKAIAGNKALKYTILHFPLKKICKFHLFPLSICQSPVMCRHPRISKIHRSTAIRTSGRVGR